MLSSARDKLAIILVPKGTIPKSLLDSLVAPLGQASGLQCQVASSIPAPVTAYDRQHEQYIGRALLATLAWLDVPNAERVLGVIDADCYAPGLNFIFGQARIHDHDAFIAVPRLQPSFYGLPEDESLFQEHALKEAVHELGHTYSLSHCRNRRCVMYFSNSLYDTDVKLAEFCPRCQRSLMKLRSGR